jgi:guanosine-3',5'-bis(diphosphate) 3'-pyrophosphohydrolase
VAVGERLPAPGADEVPEARSGVDSQGGEVVSLPEGGGDDPAGWRAPRRWTEDLLVERVAQLPGGDPDLVRMAYRFAAEAHQGQVRASGEPYIEHPLQVAGILAELGLDTPTVVAGLLHDVVEDTPVTLDDVRRTFGPEIADLVDGATKLEHLSRRTRAEQQAENFRKMFLAMARDIRVVLIKLADRLHNMRTLGHLEPARQRRLAEETLEVYAPLAHRLGIFRFKWELEDLALRYLDPQAYYDLARRIPQRRADRERFAQVLMRELKQRLEEAGIRAEVSGRAKHFYSIYQKMYKQGKDIHQIYDLVAVRVLVETIKDCYAVLGVVHTVWKPIPGRFKDYIATPKSNMYQSLHTTVVGPDGEPFEIQIRTYEMHRTAEYGIAAHWMYKEGVKGDRNFNRKLSWLREILDWQRELRDAREFMESLKIDMFADEVFVFTPRGDVFELPAGSTPIDFAYRVHTEVGHHCAGAKVNGRLVPLDTRLQNGDIVEILTSKAATPSPDWLSIVRTGLAKNRIRQWLKKERRPEAVALGREALERECRRLGLDPGELLRPEWLAEVAQRFTFVDSEDLLAAVGFGGASAAQVVGRLRERWRKAHAEQQAEARPEEPAPKPPRQPAPGAAATVRVRGERGVLVRFSRCCHPVPGDPIVGYLTRGRGVTIHHPDCPNIQAHRNEPERIIEVSWDAVQCASYPVELEITGYDRPGLLSDITKIVAEGNHNILYASARGGTRAGQALIDVVMEVRDLAECEAVRRQILRVRDVLSAERTVRSRARGLKALGGPL